MTQTAQYKVANTKLNQIAGEDLRESEIQKLELKLKLDERFLKRRAKN